MANGGSAPGVRRTLGEITAEIKVLMKELEKTAKEEAKLTKILGVAKKAAPKKK